MSELDDIINDAVITTFNEKTKRFKLLINDPANKKISPAYINEILKDTSGSERAANREVNEILSERQNKFFNLSDPDSDKYFFISDFYHKYLEPELGFKDSREEEMGVARKNANADYTNHGFYPKLKRFLAQTDQEIVKKIGEYLGYNNAVEFIQSKNYRIKEENSNQIELGKLFRNTETFNEFLSILANKSLIINNTWEGFEAKIQEIGAAAMVLKKNKWIDSSVNQEQFCRALIQYYNLSIQYSSSFRSHGNAYGNAKDEFEKLFPPIKIIKSSS